MRRCGEAREDFTEKDGNLWPMFVHEGGQPFSFCPGKATWDPEVKSTLRLLVVAAESGAMIERGGLGDQPSWWVETLSWFLPAYRKIEFFSRVRAVIGDGKPAGGRMPPTPPRKAKE